MASPVILVVDDEALIRWSLKEHLHQAGYQVKEAGTGSQALRSVNDGHDEPVSIVLLDYKLPDMSGLDVLKRIKSAKPGCKIILMTAHGTPELAAEAERLGVYKFLNKPFDYQDIVSLVRAALPSKPAQ